METTELLTTSHRLANNVQALGTLATLSTQNSLST